MKAPLVTAAILAAFMQPGLTRAEAAAPTTAPASIAAPSASVDETFDFFLKEAEVVTASRRAQKKSDSPVAIDVITREEILQNPGLQLWDLLRFRVGVNVVEATSIEGNRAMVSVRGLPDEFAQGLQVLVDGRSVVSQTTQGVYWNALPVAIDDIERIEIVRGPNAALFGSNAAQGVINIITRAPQASGGDVRMQAASFQDNRIYANANAETELGLLRVSGQKGARAESWTAPDGSALFNGNQDLDSEKVMARLSSKPWSGALLDVSTGGNRDLASVPTSFAASKSLFVNDYERMKLTQTVNEDLSLELSASRGNNAWEGISNSKDTVYDAELVTRLQALEAKSQSALGVSFRHAHAFSDTLYSGGFGPTGTDHENRVKRVFLSQSYQLLESTTLSGAASYENSDLGGDQYAVQGAVVIKPVENWGLRLSGSKAPTLPSMLNRYMSEVFVLGVTPNAFGPGSMLISQAAVLGNQDIQAAQVTSYEATVSGSMFDKKLTLEVTPYQMELNGYVEFNIYGNPLFDGSGLSGWPPPVTGVGIGTQLLRYENNYYVVLHGVETALTFKPTAGTRIQVNHTYEDVAVNDRAGGAYRYVNTTPWNIVNALLYTKLGWGFNGSTNVHWAGQHIGYMPSRASAGGVPVYVPDQAKIDLRLGYNLSKDMEVYVQGLNLAAQMRTEGEDGTAVPQAYMAGLHANW